MQYIKCNLCGSENFVHLFSASHYLSYPEEFNIVKCKDCGLVFLNPRPDDEELNKYYSPEYFSEVAEPGFFKRCFALDKVRLIKNLKSRGRLLDVGCGRGEFLQQMEDYGWEVWGVDTSAVACKYTQERLRNGKIFNQDLLTSNLPEAYFDIVTFWHSLEHLKDPFSSLTEARRILKEDGILVIACPNFSSFSSKFFKRRWYALDTPFHLYQFSPLTLQKLLKRAGFRISKLSYGQDLFSDMVSFKFSLLRWLSREDVILERTRRILVIKGNFLKLLWITGRFLLNIFCLLSSILLVILKKGDIILCYCEAAVKANETS